jgi:hypothetical protein
MAKYTPCTDSCVKFDLKFTINGQKTKREAIFRRAGQVSKIRDDNFVAEEDTAH